MATALELLAPARNLACGIAAIDHGADAVYIGATTHGARAAAGNSVDDIGRLCKYAHRFLAKVYVTVNTIVYDNELAEVERLLLDLDRVGVDAVLVQDMVLVALVTRMRSQRRLSMALHASTQTDNRSPEKVEWLARMGCERVVLARELSVDEMAEIHRRVPQVQLEAFVHGALCVSFSGVCYASQWCFGRSANRGECAQFCRLPFQLLDAEGKAVGKPRHWLSLRDMCRISLLGQMAKAGVVSFKVEGRLKDETYVKNVVAAYHSQLSRVVDESGGRYCRLSLGVCHPAFTPDLHKTFNRGFTDYFATRRRGEIASPDTPKALGEYVGEVKQLRRDSFTVAGIAAFANGDGLCFFDADRQLTGFRVNRAEGNRIYPLRMPKGLKQGVGLYRNSDVAFERLLANSGERKIPVAIGMDVEDDELRLDMTVEGRDIAVTVRRCSDWQQAQKQQRDNMCRQLSKLGGTVYHPAQVIVADAAARLFVPSSMLADMRREAVALLDEAVAQQHRRQREATDADAAECVEPMPVPDTYRHHGYMYNVANRVAEDFYKGIGQQGVDKAMELEPPKRGQHRMLMQCRHCIRHLLGYCTRQRKPLPWHEPLALRMSDGQTFRLEFDCRNCQMLVYTS